MLRRWADLDGREAAVRVDPGDVFLLDPDRRVDARLTLYLTRSSFARLARETRRNYAEDCCIFFNFLWSRSKGWDQATADDLLDFEDWRRWSTRNPRRISGAKWNRELAALRHLYGWAQRKGFVRESPVAEREVRGRHGELIRVAAARAKDVRSSNVKWLTPRAYRLWRDVGLRGYTGDGRRDSAWRGRNDDRNAAYSDVLFSSGMRRTEGASLLAVEVPVLTGQERLYVDGRLGRAVTKSRRERTFYLSVDALRAVTAYAQTTRRAAIRRAQSHGRYADDGDRVLVVSRSGWGGRVLHCQSADGVVVARSLNSLDVEERQRLFVEGDTGPEPLWLWLAEDGSPFLPHSWEAVYRAASQRCKRLLAGRVAQPPFFTPHMARHSFALYMLVALQHALDNRFQLSAQERHDFRLLYGDAWQLVKTLLDHASEETTRAIYLAPVSDLQVRSLLQEQVDGGVSELLAQIAQQSQRVVDTEVAW